jgi:hypothetical protein
LKLEPLEDRRLLAALLVNSPLDNTASGDGLVTLREAILAANSDTTTDLGQKGNFADTISFDFGHDGPQTIELTMGQLTIDSDLTIVGAGSGLLTIDASASDTLPDMANGTGSRVFDIALRPTIGWNVTLRHMTLTGGDSDGRGGAIQAAGHLTLDDVSIVGNAATNHGGAIYTTHRLNVSDSDLVDNHSQGSGGGIYVEGSNSLLLSNAHISGNTSAFDGGGLFVDDSDFTIVHSTITDNHADPGAQFRGGGIYVRDTIVLAAEAVITANVAASGGGIYALRSRLTFNDSQINQNEALAGNGGGIYIEETPIGVALNFSTMTGNKSSQDGGAIYARSSLAAVNDSIIGGNEAESHGGGIMVRNNALRVVRSRVTGNVAGGNGGGLVSYTAGTPTASMYVADSAIDNNQANGSGGGLYAYRISASTITHSTFHKNMANWGGAVSVREIMSLSVIDSTLSENHAVTSGGAIIAQQSGVSLLRSTVTGNSAASNPDGTGASGGIIAYDGSKVSLGHTILAGNHDPSTLGPDLYLFPNVDAPTLSASFSLIGDNSGTDLAEAPVGSPSAAGNLIGGPMNGMINPQLGPLTYNGGPALPDGSPLLTHAVLPGSPAIDAGDPAAMAGVGIDPLYDQRGMPLSRVVDGDGAGGARIDMGAYERQESAPFHLFVDTLADELDGDYSSGDFSLREAIEIANLNPEPDEIAFAPSLTAAGPAAILLTMGELEITDSVKLNGPGSALLTIDAQSKSRIINITETKVDVAISDLTFTNGKTTGSVPNDTDFIHSGGAIRSISTVDLIVNRIAIRDSGTEGTEARGGGLFAFGNVTLTQSVLTGNSAGASGGGISSMGTAMLDRTMVSGNSANAGGGGVAANSVVAIDSQIVDNQTTGVASSGGGIRAGASASFTNSVISGNATTGASSGGGGISSGGSLTLSRSVVDGNSTSGHYADGGGLHSDGSVSLTETVVTGNSTSGDFADGGGIFASGDATLMRSLVDNNETMGGAAPGGGIFVIGRTLIDSSTVSNNRTHGDDSRGGGIGSGVNQLTLINSIVSGNTTFGGETGASFGAVGAGISAFGEVTVSYSTIVHNQAVESKGGGVWMRDDPITIIGSIIAENTAPAGSPDLFPSAEPLTALHSLIGDSSGTTLVEAPLGAPDANGNFIGGPVNGAIDPLLSPLAFNGGTMLPDGHGMLTHALLPGSPAIDAGDPAAVAGMSDVPLYDQRGMPFSRVANGDDVPEARIDLGAFEWQTNPLAGDYNYSGIVDAADFVLWRKTLGSTNDLRANGDGDADVDQDDYAVWRANFGAVATLPLAASAVILQPTGSGDDSVTYPRPRQSFDTTASTISRRSEALSVVRKRMDTAPTVNDEALLAWLAGLNGSVRIRPSSASVEFSDGQSAFSTDNTLPLDAVFTPKDSDDI